MLKYVLYAGGKHLWRLAMPLCTPQNVIEPPCIIIRLLDYYTVASSKYVNKDKSIWNRSDLSECSVVWCGSWKGGFLMASHYLLWQVFVGPAGAKEASPISGACYACYAATRAGKGWYGDTLPIKRCNQKGSKGSEHQNMSFSSIPANLESMVKRIS